MNGTESAAFREFIYERVDKPRPIELLQALLADPRCRVSLERHGGSWRLRWREPMNNGSDPCWKRVSRAVPNSLTMLYALQERLSEAKEWRREAKRKVREAARASAMAERNVDKVRRELRRKVQDASCRGRWMRSRIGKVFDIAASLGDDWVADYIAHSPWKARSRIAGRPRRPMGGWGAGYRPPIDMGKD